MLALALSENRMARAPWAAPVRDTVVRRPRSVLAPRTLLSCWLSQRPQASGTGVWSDGSFEGTLPPRWAGGVPSELLSPCPWAHCGQP